MNNPTPPTIPDLCSRCGHSSPAQHRTNRATPATYCLYCRDCSDARALRRAEADLEIQPDTSTGRRIYAELNDKAWLPDILAIEAEARSTPAEALDPPLVVSHLRRLTDAARAILAADSPDHTITPTDDQWGELDAATDEASAYLESGRGFDD